MRLRTKSSLLLVTVIALYGLAEGIVLDRVVMPGFVELEQIEARRDISRCVDAIGRETHHLKDLCRDWAAWDDTYKFIQDKNESYISANLNTATLAANEFALLHYYDHRGTLIWGTTTKSTRNRKLVVPELSQGHLDPSHPLLNYKLCEALEASGTTGLLLAEAGALIIASGPIINSSNQGPIRGTLVMARYLGPSTLATLRTQTRVDFKIWNLDSQTDLSQDQAEALLQLQGRDKQHLDETDTKTLRAYATLRDIHGKQALLIRADLPRKITQQGRDITNVALISTIIGSLLALGLLILSISSLVIRPVAALTVHVKSISKSQDFERRLNPTRDDELGILGRSIDTMAENICEARTRLVEQSFHAGLAEMTENILHNVRNSMLPISGLVEASRETLLSLPVDRIDQALTELETADLDHERSQALSTYVRRSGSRLTRSVRESLDLLDQVLSFADGLSHVLEGHEKLTQAKGAVEPHQLPGIIRSAINLVEDSLQGHLAIDVSKDLAKLPRANVERTTLSLILAKILDSIAVRIKETPDANRRVTIDAQESPDSSIPELVVSITDQVPGLDAEDIHKLFRRTSQHEASIGTELDLHWCANALTTMGGSISIESSREKPGSTFRLIIPAWHKEQIEPSSDKKGDQEVAPNV